MQKATLFFSLTIVHEWYGDTTPALSVNPSAAAENQMRRDGLLFRTRAGGCEVYANSDNFGGTELELNVVSQDPFLITRTFTGEHGAGSLVANITLTAEESDKLIGPDDWQQAKSPKEHLAKVAVILPSAPLPLTSILRIPTITTYWTYVVTGNSLPDELEINANDGSECFSEISMPAPDHGVRTRSFRSATPRRSIRNDQSKYQLVSSDRKTRPLISRLPYPAPGVHPRPIPGSSDVEDLIYVYL